MNPKKINLKKRQEAGVALLIALFVLLLISVVALSMVMATGMETSLASNYRSSASVYYASLAGLEEARGRLAGSNTDNFNKTTPGFIPAPPVALAVGQVRYVLNPLPGEVVSPWITSNPFADKEYITEFATPVPTTAPAMQSIASVSSVTTGGTTYLGPMFKWVRINAATEKSLNVDVNHDGVLDAVIPVYYDSQNVASGSVKPSLIVSAVPPATARQVFEITAMAVLPNGSQKLSQYVVGDTVMPVVIDAAVSTKLAQNYGDALNVTGNTDAACNLPNKAGGKSGSTITTPGGGNVTGSPAVSPNNPQAPYDTLIAGFFNTITATNPIDSPGTGVTGSGSPQVYTGPHANLGTVPTVSYDGNGGITTITNPGVPATYLAGSSNPADSTGAVTVNLVTSALGGAAVNGQGVLLIHGNLNIDITNGFNYFGLIVVTGDIFMTANSSTSATSNIHGAIIGGGKFSSNLTNLGGSVFIHQNACMVNTAINVVNTENVLSFRELAQ